MSNLIWLLIGIIILLLIIGLIQLRTPSRIMNTRFAKLIFKNTTLGDRLCELFYGVTMVSVMIGIINITASGYTNIKHVLLVVAFGVNITWGIIDGTTSVYGGLVDQAEEDRLVNSLRRNKQNQQYIDHLKDDLQATILRKLNDGDQSRVIDMVREGTPEDFKKYGASIEDVKSFLAILMMDFITVFPVLIHLYIVDDIPLAIFWSRFIAVLLFIIIGMAWAKYLNKNMFMAGAATGILGIAILAVSFYFGW